MGSEDYVEVRGGDGLDPSMMSVAEDFCGMDSVQLNRVHEWLFSGRSSVDVACGNSAVRLVSSGKFENSVTVSFDLLMDWVPRVSFALRSSRHLDFTNSLAKNWIRRIRK
ncbi:corticotropin-releasing factor-binding protein [Caerostris extrusa]|uniref:Corticotropin-releasing factor-binding protein n=1 Tax=Caerostris extrusa TaxID=172846 RepID=A0AAV4NRB4_CAEEX|nr:corticotropin-releasing factor-binding protein [Caerostris extrusa]